MAFELVEEAWVDHHTTICKGVLMFHCEKGVAYTNAELIEILALQGFVYSVPDFQKIRVELFKRGILIGEDE